jgi:hypothetical protein
MRFFVESLMAMKRACFYHFLGKNVVFKKFMVEMAKIKNIYLFLEIEFIFFRL